MTDTRKAAPGSGIEAFIGTEFPGGTYTITPERNALFLKAVDGIESRDGNAHPIMHFIATHAGKGMSFEQLVAFLGIPLDAGALFGQEDLEIFRPVRIGETVEVRGSIVDAGSKNGAKTGAFDTLTTAIELVDAGGNVCCRSLETYIFPRKADV